MSQTAIAIIGCGIVSAIGNDYNSVLQSLREKRSGIEPMRFLKSIHNELPVGEVKLTNEQMKRMLNIDEDTIVSRTTLMGAIAVKEALSNANISDLEHKRVSFMSGTTVAGMDITENLFEQFKNDDTILQYIDKHDCGNCSNEIVKICGIHADVCTISTACSSALNSIIIGTEMLLNDETDVVIAGGCEALSLFHLNGFNSLMILDKERCRPFDATRAGLNLGEGAAFLVLQRAADAATKPKAYICGYGNRCDAHHQTAMSDNGEGPFLAMKEALQRAEITSAEIDYINAHGTGTLNNDMTESAALKRVFGDNLPLISSTKAFTGHTTSAAGAIEAVISLMALNEKFVPANLGWKKQMTDGIMPSSGQLNKELHTVMCNSFGFGGNCSSIIISDSVHCLPDCNAFDYEIVSEDEITDIEELKGIREYVPPMESRRMSKIIKAATLTSLRALQKAGVDCPDAIIASTAMGLLETSEKFLESMIANGETSVSPTQFMQSTHNTIASAIAIRTQCHGYNITYSQGDQSLNRAMQDAIHLIKSGKAKTVLVGYHDESTELYNTFMQRLGRGAKPAIISKSFVIRAKG